MKLSANEAAKQTGKSVPTITRAIKSGKMSADRTESGGYQIDPAELFRVFPAVKIGDNETQNTLHNETTNVTLHETRILEERVRFLEAALTDAKAERDEWRDQAKRLALTIPAPESNDKTKPRPFWRFW